jgi:hypothetical protein
MNLLRIAALWMCFCAAAFAQAISLTQAVTDGKVRADIAGNGRESAAVKITNLGADTLTVSLAAGTMLDAKDGERQVSLRALETKLAAGATVEATLPTAALASRNAKADRALMLSTHTEPRLAPLMKLFENQNDLPRATAQLAVFILIEDIQWRAWRAWSAASAGKSVTDSPTPAEVAQAVDALALVRLAAPDRKPAMLASEDLKRLALRNPTARAKAMALYGLTVDNALTGDPGVPPDLRQLLHTSPNDNCPICRMRQKMEPDMP